MTTRRTCAAAAALILISAPAFSKPVHTDEDAPRQAAASYADLNLNTARGQAILVARIHRAAEAVCGPEPDSRDLARAPADRQCMKQRVDAAVAAIPTARDVAGSARPAG